MFGQGPFGAYALGQPAPDIYTLHVSAGAFVLSPKTVNLGPKIQKCGVAAFTLNRKAVNLLYHPRGDTATRAFTLSPGAAGLTYYSGSARVLIADVGHFALAPKTAGLNHSRIMATAPGSFAETGVASLLATHHKLVAAKGVFIDTSQTANLVRSRIMMAAQGSFVDHAGSVTFQRTRAIQAAPGAFVWAGHNALVAHQPLIAASVPFSIAPQTADLMRSRIVKAATGRYFLNGNPAVRTIAPPSATFVMDGGPAEFVYSWTPLAVDPGALVLAAQTADLVRTKTLYVAPGAFVLDDAPAGHSVLHALNAITSTYALAGIDVLMTYTRAVIAGSGAFVLQSQPAALLATHRLYPGTGAIRWAGRKAEELSGAGVAELHWQTPAAGAKFTEQLRAS